MLRSMMTILACPTCGSTYVRCDYDETASRHHHTCESCGLSAAISDDLDEFSQGISMGGRREPAEPGVDMSHPDDHGILPPRH